MVSFSNIKVWGFILFFILSPISVNANAQICPTGQIEQATTSGFICVASGAAAALISATTALGSVATTGTAGSGAANDQFNANANYQNKANAYAADRQLQAACCPTSGPPTSDCHATIIANYCNTLNNTVSNDINALSGTSGGVTYDPTTQLVSCSSTGTVGLCGTLNAANTAFNNANGAVIADTAAALGTAGAKISRINSASLMNPNIGGVTGANARIGLKNDTTAALGLDAAGNALTETTQPHAITAIVTHYTNSTTASTSAASCPHGILMGTAGVAPDSSGYLFWQCLEKFFNTEAYYISLSANNDQALCPGSTTEYCTLYQPKTVLVTHYIEHVNQGTSVTLTCPSNSTSTTPVYQLQGNHYLNMGLGFFALYWQCNEKLFDSDAYYPAAVQGWVDCHRPIFPHNSNGSNYNEECTLLPHAYCFTNFSGNNPANAQGDPARGPISSSDPSLPLYMRFVQICPGTYHVAMTFHSRCNQTGSGRSVCAYRALITNVNNTNSAAYGTYSQADAQASSANVSQGQNYSDTAYFTWNTSDGDLYCNITSPTDTVGSCVIDNLSIGP